jgi:hypothetical protein
MKRVERRQDRSAHISPLIQVDTEIRPIGIN